LEYVNRVGRGEVVRIEAELRTKDGSVVWSDITGIPKKNRHGKLSGLISVNRDITERKRAEERFRLAVEAAPAAMIMVDPNGNIVLANAVAERLFGYGPGEILGISVERLVPERLHNHQLEYRTN